MKHDHVSSFAPARHSTTDQKRPNRDEITVDFDVFEDVNADESRLVQVYEERQEAHDWIEPDFFAVLDGTSAENHTVWMYLYHSEFNDDTDELVGRRWIRWRIPFANVQYMNDAFVATPEIVERVFVDLAEKYTGEEDGVFRVEDAMRAKGYVKD